MPFSDARDFLAWAHGKRPESRGERMTADDFRQLREMGGSRG